MQKTFKLKVTTTRRRVVTVSGAAVSAYCPACLGEVPTLTCREAAGFLEIGEEDLAGLIALGKVHAAETASGSFRICQPSLLSGKD